MAEQGTRTADEANEYLQRRGIPLIREFRDEVENLKELLKLHNVNAKEFSSTREAKDLEIA